MWTTNTPVSELLRAAWLRRVMRLSVMREIGNTQWSAESSPFQIWEEPNFFVCLMANREPVLPIAKAEMSVTPENLPGPQQLIVQLMPPQSVDNTLQCVPFDFTAETLDAQIERVMDAVVLFFRCVRGGWSWPQYQSLLFQGGLHASVDGGGVPRSA